MKALKFYLPALVLATVLFVGCQKDATQDPALSAEAKEASAMSSVSDQTIVDMQTMGEQSLSASLKSFGEGDSSIVPSRDHFELNHDSTDVRMNFGKGLLCGDGKMRKGFVRILRMHPPSNDSIGTVTTYTTDGYEVNGYKVALTATITYVALGKEAPYVNGYRQYSVVVNSGVIVRPNGDTITVDVNQTRKLLSKPNSTLFAGWAISGTSSHTLVRHETGLKFGVTTVITTDLLQPLKFHHFIAGEFTSTFLSGKTVTVNYGNGDIFNPKTWNRKKVSKSDNVTETATQE